MKKKKVITFIILLTVLMSLIMWMLIGLYKMILAHSFTYMISFLGFLVIPVCVSYKKIGKCAEMEHVDLVCYPLMQLEVTLLLFLTFLYVIIFNIGIEGFNERGGLIISLSILSSEIIAWLSIRQHIIHTKKKNLFNGDYHKCMISAFAKFFTVITFFYYVSGPFIVEDNSEMYIVLSFGGIFCIYDLVLSTIEWIKKKAMI